MVLLSWGGQLQKVVPWRGRGWRRRPRSIRRSILFLRSIWRVVRSRCTSLLPRTSSRDCHYVDRSGLRPWSVASTPSPNSQNTARFRRKVRAVRHRQSASFFAIVWAVGCFGSLCLVGRTSSSIRHYVDSSELRPLSVASEPLANSQNTGRNDNGSRVSWEARSAEFFGIVWPGGCLGLLRLVDRASSSLRHFVDSSELRPFSVAGKPSPNSQNTARKGNGSRVRWQSGGPDMEIGCGREVNRTWRSPDTWLASRIRVELGPVFAEFRCRASRR